MLVNDPTVITVCLLLSVMRIFLEVIGFKFESLPMTARLPKEQQNKIHRYGFYMSVGYFILFAPEILLS